MASEQEYLFNGTHISDVLEGQKTVLEKRVREIPADRFLSTSEEGLVQALLKDFRLEVPVMGKPKVDKECSGETQIDLSGDPHRKIRDRSQPSYVIGRKIVISVPFTGNREFFEFRSQGHGSNPPRAEIREGKLLLTYLTTDHNTQAVTQTFEKTVRDIKQHLAGLADSVAQYNNQLEGLIVSHVKARMERLQADAKMIAEIDLWMKKRQQEG